ncbi:MAG: ferritin-like domain-containing protein [bacterium]|nr:ferritin-like domain-containing protein [bacterium]
MEKEKRRSEALTIIRLGPVTDAYMGDIPSLIKQLNILRSTELVAYLQYKHHAYMAVSLAMPAIRDEFLEHARTEEKHADRLGERIQQLGGNPVFQPDEIAKLACQHQIEAESAPTLHEMLLEDLALERKQIEAYTLLIRQVGMQDPTTRRLLEKILADTEEHASELRNMLQRRNPAET